jgi:hypothetical protein
VGGQNPVPAGHSATESCSGLVPQETKSTAAGSAQTEGLMPARVVFSVTPQVVGGQLFLYYVLENHSEATLLTDILRLRISDRNGDRVTFRINRVSQDGYLGRLQPDGVEYGLIAIDTLEKLLRMEWRLLRLGSGTQETVRIEVEVQ